MAYSSSFKLDLFRQGEMSVMDWLFLKFLCSNVPKDIINETDDKVQSEL